MAEAEKVTPIPFHMLRHGYLWTDPWRGSQGWGWLLFRDKGYGRIQTTLLIPFPNLLCSKCLTQQLLKYLATRSANREAARIIHHQQTLPFEQPPEHTLPGSACASGCEQGTGGREQENPLSEPAGIPLGSRKGNKQEAGVGTASLCWDRFLTSCLFCHLLFPDLGWMGDEYFLISLIPFGFYEHQY